ncbi:hypothetical protein Tco_0610434 [Tanacetum coccineum]
MLVQPTEDEGAPSKRPSEALPTPSPALTSEVPNEPHTDLSPTQTKTSGGNFLEVHSSVELITFRGDEGELTLQVSMIFVSLYVHRFQIKPRKYKQLEAQHILTRKSISKNPRVHKESVSKQGRKFAKGEPSVQRDPLFDELPEDTVDHMETENAQDVGRTREIVDEEKDD